MSVGPSKLVTDRQKSSLAVQSTRVSIEPVAAAFVEHFPTAVRGAARSAILFVCGLLLDWLALRTDEMVRADMANAAEAGDDALVRGRRDEAAARVRSGLVDLREVLVACFGKPVLALFGIEGRTPSDPVVLQRVGAAALARLHGFAPEGGRFTFLAAEWIAHLEAPVAELERALEAVAVDERQNQFATGEKLRAMDAYDFAFRATANFLTGLFAAAGREDLARRVRPSTRRAGQTAEDAPNVSGYGAAAKIEAPVEAESEAKTGASG